MVEKAYGNLKIVDTRYVAFEFEFGSKLFLDESSVPQLSLGLVQLLTRAVNFANDLFGRALEVFDEHLGEYLLRVIFLFELPNLLLFSSLLGFLGSS